VRPYAGTTSVTKKGDLKGYGSVWYHPDGIANILSYNNVKKKYRVTYDCGQEDGFVVQKGGGTKFIFRPSSRGYSTWMIQTTSVQYLSIL